ncbi:hypothetical protein [Demetria terragena]|uniref:hypothetical protein n=1 Tax=Demetria terragena TaxID=63959 RepID=UPI000377F10C|nr:hypothetical protein [Demetria terragena]
MDLAFQIVFSVTVVVSLVGVVLLCITLVRSRGDEEKAIFGGRQWLLTAAVAGGGMTTASILSGHYDELLFQDVFLVASTGGLAGATLGGFGRWRRERPGAGVLSVLSVLLPLVCGVLAAFAPDTL